MHKATMSTIGRHSQSTVYRTEVSRIPSVPPENCEDSTLKWATIGSFHIHHS